MKDDDTFCDHCTIPETSGGIRRTDNEHSQQHHCSAMEVHPDHRHASLFPVNCSEKFWNIVLCENKSHQPKDINIVRALQNWIDKNTCIEDNIRLDDYTNKGNAIGEYWINNNALRQAQFICPDGYIFFVRGYCMRLRLLNNDLLIQKSKRHFFRAFSPFDYEAFCNLARSTTDNFKFSLSVLVIVDILEEFFPEGSDFYAIQACISRSNIYSYHYLYWLPPPNYPTYIPCLHSRNQVSAQKINDVSIYTCEDGSVIAEMLVCNDVSDCSKSEDEDQCPTCSWTDPLKPSCSCTMFHYQCERGGCVHYDHICDSSLDCPDGDDETLCHDNNKFKEFTISSSESFTSDLSDPPSGDVLMCRTKLQCYNSSAICHYDHSGGVMAHCEDGSHMGWGSHCRFVECRKQYKCLRSYCIPTRKICDGFTDCPVGDDEEMCSEYSCPGHMRCSGVTYCVPPHEICDGISHCPHQEDEKYCQVCPQGCHCKGTAIYCSNVESLLLKQNLYSPSALILYKAFSVFCALYNQLASKMNYVYLIDLKYGSFVSLLEHKVDISGYFLSVKLLFLNHQGLSTLFSKFINGPNIIYLNLSHNSIRSVQEHAFYLVKNVKTLSLVSNKINSLESHFCNELGFLSSLYLSDNPLINIAANVFLENLLLVVIRSDWYMVCCVAIGTEDCQPQNQFVSSCSNLISSTAQRVCIMAQGIIVIVGNTGALVVQFTLLHVKTAEKMLIVSLIFADMLMGVYLLALETVDFMYSMVFYKIVSEWTNSMTCVMFGLLSYISSEVSLLMLNILAFARMISIKKVGGMTFLKGLISMACVSVWAVVLISGITYGVYLLTQHIGARNNMCILFGVSYLGHITQFERIVQIVGISINMLLILSLIVSMIGIFYIALKSHRSVIKVSGQRVRSQRAWIIHMSLKLLLLVSCNILTWLPFLTVSILLLAGIPVHENIIQWVVVVGLPICASTDPILYTLSSLKGQMKKK